MERNMLAGAADDKLNAMFAAVGFNLVKLMRGLKRLFLCLRTKADGFVGLLAELLRLIAGEVLPEPAVIRTPPPAKSRIGVCMID